MESVNSLVTVLSGAAVPLLARLLIKKPAPIWMVSLLNLLLSVAAGGFAAAGAAGHLTAEAFFAGVGQTWVVSIATYYGFYKPTGIAPKLADLTAGVGFGKAGAASPATPVSLPSAAGEAAPLTEADVALLRLMKAYAAMVETDKAGRAITLHQ